MDDLSDGAAEIAATSRYEEALKAERRQVVWICAIGSAFLLLLLAAFYPKGISNIDESSYLSASSYLLQGMAFDKTSAAWFWKPQKDNETLRRALNSTSPLFSTILMPFVAAGWRSSFALGVVAHILGFIGMVFLLRWRGLSPVWALLYLLYPPFVLYSRTAMIDVPAASLVVLILVLLHRREPNHYLVGLAMGFTVLLKVSALPVVMAFFGLVFLQDIGEAWKTCCPSRGLRESRWLRMAIGGFPFAVALLLANVFLFNTITGSAYVGFEGGTFGFSYLARNLPFYTGSLLVMYPLMLIAPVFMKGAHAWEFRCSCLVALLFFGSYYFIDEGNTSYERLIRGQRFLLITMPFFIVAYAEMWTRLAYTPRREKALRLAFAAMVVALVPVGVVIAMKHQQFTAEQARRTAELSEALPENARVMPASMVAKWLNAAVRPDLRILRLARTKFVPQVLGDAKLPVYILVGSGRAVSTHAYQDQANRERIEVLGLARKYFDLKELDSGLSDMDIWVVEGVQKDASMPSVSAASGDVSGEGR